MDNVEGPLDAVSGRDDAAAVIGMFGDRTGPLTQKEWEKVLESRRELIYHKKGSIFYKRLGNVSPLGLGHVTLSDDAPEVDEDVLDWRGVFFEDAAEHPRNPERTIFPGISTDGGWLLVTVRTKWNENTGSHSRDIAVKVQVQKCRIRDILTVIDPLNLFRWMNSWVEELRDSRYQRLMEVIKLEALFAAQDWLVQTRNPADEYIHHRLMDMPAK